jgi:hypothetical protein
MPLSRQLCLFLVGLSAGICVFLSRVLLQSVVLLQAPPSASKLALDTFKQGRVVAESDTDCLFRKSSIYQSVYVYPSPGDDEWSGNVLSSHGRSMTGKDVWPWIRFDQQARANASSHYDTDGQHVQYATELLVRELLTNPHSCLRSYDPETATLFYIPYLPSMEFHQGSKYTNLNYSTSKYGQAIMDILHTQSYEAWENVFGLTSKYWKRRNGSDHILVFSEPIHGLWHPRNKRGNFHYIRTQKQIASPIVLSVELSTSFVNDYPACARKNILLPYPNTDGRLFNGAFQKQARQIAHNIQRNQSINKAALAVEQKAANGRPAGIYYAAGNHGTCPSVRRNLEREVQTCSSSFSIYHKEQSRRPVHGMWLSTFCPAPGGDSPSAKRMFDAVTMGCIPIVLSHDFVWPFTTEFDPGLELESSAFSLRMNASDFETPVVDYKTCQPRNPVQLGMLQRIEQVSLKDIQKLRQGVVQAGNMYSWYKKDGSIPDNPLRERILPNGGAAHMLVHELEKRALGVRWPACQEEYERKRLVVTDAKQFKC